MELTSIDLYFTFNLLTHHFYEKFNISPKNLKISKTTRL